MPFSNAEQMKKNRLALEAKDDERSRLIQLEKVASYAKWENDTDARAAQDRKKQTMFGFQAQANSELDQRREELAKMYERELNSWKGLLLSQQETASDVKERIRAKALALKQKREAEQGEYVNHQRMRQWRDGCDDLRQLDSQATLNDVAQRRSEQLDEKARQQYQDLQDEDQWSNAWEVDRLRKEQRERRDLAAQHGRDQDQKRDLDLQVKQNSTTAYNAKDQQSRESDAQREQWAVEDQKQKEFENAYAAANYKRGQDVLQYNNTRLIQRTQAAQTEMENELTLLQVALEKERRELEAEEEKKRQEKEASQIYQKHLQAQMVREKADDSLLEELRRQDEQRAADKRDSQKHREDKARSELASQVQIGRERQKQEKLGIVADQRESDRLYANDQAALNIQLNDMELEKKAMQAKARKDNQSKVRLQVSAKEQVRNETMQREYLANRSNQYREKVYNEQLMTFAGQARKGY